MKKCPGCGSLAQDSDDTCALCGSSLAAAQSGHVEELEKLEQSESQNKKDDHWKIKALAPRLIVYIVTVALILSGFMILSYSTPPSPSSNPCFVYISGGGYLPTTCHSAAEAAGWLLIGIGVLVLAYVAISAGPRYRSLRWPQD